MRVCFSCDNLVLIDNKTPNNKLIDFIVEPPSNAITTKVDPDIVL